MIDRILITSDFVMSKDKATADRKPGRLRNIISRILIASDFVMTKEKEQASNRKWLLDLLRYPISQATGITPETFSSSLVQENLFSRIRFFELSGIKLDIDTAHFWYENDKIGDESLAYLREYLRPTDLVIGYELGQQTRELLNRIGVAWIDIWLHPIRFLDDILFGFSASDPAVYQAMQPFHIAEDVFRLYADRISIQYYRGYKRHDLPIKHGSALFVGQTLEDKALCDGGRMLNLLDFKESFEQIGKQYGSVYYSRHPHVKKGDEAILKYVKACGFAKVVDFPTYQMLASGRLAKVFSISSSVVHEAKYFRLETEYLFQPAVQYGTRHGEEYLSIYQEFISPHFWSQALASLMPTQDCKRVMFLDQKDKLRDMLGFYWSYRHVDKIENMRQSLLAIDRRLQSLIPKPKPAQVAAASIEPIAPGVPWADVCQQVEEMMSHHAVVSFDVFGTLIERPFAQPNDLFDYLEPQARALTGLPELSFRKAREAARALVTDGRHGEEITLAERCQALVRQLGLDAATGQRLQAMEEEAELRFCRPRPAGRELYDSALRMGKRVVLVSDIFFEADFMHRLLAANGYDRHEQLFLSSTEGKLKQTGNIYPVVLQALGIKPAQMLHIGDNVHADIQRAAAHGINTWHLPRAVETFSAKSRLVAPLTAKHRTLASVMRGLVANRLNDNPLGMTTPSHAGRYPADFGYAVAGPLFFGFAKWVLEQAIADGVQTLYFLARDGDIVKRCYDMLAPHYPGTPRAAYLRASRRGVNVAALQTEADVLDMLAVNFTPTPISELLKHRFGIESIPVEFLTMAGYSSAEDTANYKADKSKLLHLLQLLAPQILANASEERRALLGYYRDMGLMNPERKAVVDIGHHGTLQASISQMVNDGALGGYYFVTYQEIESRVLAKGMGAKGYLADRINGSAKNHAYSIYLLMFEALFLNTEGTFVRIRREAGEWRPELLPTDMEAGRINFIRQVHDAAVEFTRDLAEVLGADLGTMPFDGNNAISGYLSLLRSPTLTDARLFDGVGFENVYSGRATRSVIQPASGDDEASIEQSLWKEGAAVFLAGAKNPANQVSTVNTTQRLVRTLARHTTPTRKYRKLLRSPRQFFSDSKNPLVRCLTLFVR